jgi:pimeloyl-ACP methyl ester carboxylesterase
MLMLGVPACATIPPAIEPGPPRPERPVVFVADGAGDFRACSGSLRKTVNADGLSLEVITYVWSHGYLRNMSDQTDIAHIRDRGGKLADLVRDVRAAGSTAPVTLVGHSAGSAVVLAAAEQLPEGSIHRIVLLAPSISEQYDLRPALKATRDGIDVFVSEKDWIWLGFLVRLLGTPDDPYAARSAGRFGFAVARDGELANKVRLHRWTPECKTLGNDGGHFGCYQPDFLRRKVVPLLKPHGPDPAP